MLQCHGHVWMLVDNRIRILLCLLAASQTQLPLSASPYMLLSAEGLAPVDLLLLMAAQENDAPRVAELIRAGADLNTKVCHGLSRGLRISLAARAHAA